MQASRFADTRHIDARFCARDTANFATAERAPHPFVCWAGIKNAKEYNDA
jgi:hypothetical protein